MLFSIGLVSTFVKGGLTGIILADSALDITVHDTYFVVAHFHIVMGVAAFFGLFAGVYHWFPKMFGRQMNSTLAYVHFFVTFIGSYLIFWPMHYQGMAGLPRWYYNHNSYESFSHLGDLSKFISTVAVIVFISQVFFIINFFWSMYKGRKVTEANPWEANTLEWTTDEMLPIHGNWSGDIPTVHRWPYDYSKDDREFIPQTEPAREGEHVV
jgi:cytochrome c oxidase subunit 1